MWNTRDNSTTSLSDQIAALEREISDKMAEVGELHARRDRLIRQRGTMLDALRESRVARRGYVRY